MRIQIRLIGRPLRSSAQSCLKDNFHSVQSIADVNGNSFVFQSIDEGQAMEETHSKSSIFSKTHILLLILTAICLPAEAGDNVGYTYDELGRLVTVTDSANSNRGYTYDKAGNRVSLSVGASSSSSSSSSISVGTASATILSSQQATSYTYFSSVQCGWQYFNQVSATWSSSPSSGLVVINYLTLSASVGNGQCQVGQLVGSYSAVASKQQTIQWPSSSQPVWSSWLDAGGISYITRVRVYIQDSSGNYTVLVADSGP